MIAEYLDLIVGVTDNFSDDLSSLAGQLQTIDTLEEKVSPITIDVEVNKRQLDKLQGDLAGTQVLDSPIQTQTYSDYAVGEDGDVTEGNTLLEQINSNLQRSTSDEVLDVTTAQFDTATFASATFASSTSTSSPATPVSPTTSSGSSSSSSIARTGGGAIQLDPDEISQMEEIYGQNAVDDLFVNSNLSVLDLIDDGGAPLQQVTQGDLNEQMGISPRQFNKAFDLDGFYDDALSEIASDAYIGGDQNLQRILGGSSKPLSDFTNQDISNILSDISTKKLESINVDRADYLNTGKLRRMRLMDSLKNFRVGMTQFYDILAAFMPMLFTFVGAMPAAIGALGGLAAAAVGATAGLVGIAGLGAMGAAMENSDGEMPSMEDFTEVVEDIPEQFFEAFAPIAQQLQPTFESGLEGLERFFNELASRGDALTALSDDAEDFGTWMIDFTSNGLQMLALLADEARPVFDLITNGLENREILAGFTEALEITLPYLTELSTTILDMLPGVVRLSTGMMMWANTILTVLSYVGWFTTSLIELASLGFLDGHRSLGIFVGGLLTLTSTLLMLIKVVGIYSTTLNVLRNSQLLANNAAYQGVLAWTSQAAQWVSAQLAAMGLTTSVTALTWAIRGLLAVTGIGLAVAGIGYAFEQTTKQIDDATSSLGDFQDTYSSLDGGGAVPGISGASGSNAYMNYTDNSQTTIQAPDRATGEELSNYNQYQDWASNESDFSTL